jgi:hypothetical protein
LAARRVVGKKAFTKKVATQDPTAAKNSAFVVGGFKREAQQGVNPKFQWRLGELALVPHALGLSSGFRFLSTGRSV